MSRLTRDGTAESISRDQILRRERGQGNIYFLCSADHVLRAGLAKPYPVDIPLLLSILICSMYVNRVRLPILHVVSWTGKVNFSLSPFAPVNLVSRDGFGNSVPRQPAQ